MNATVKPAVMRRAPGKSTRFASPTIEPERVRDLAADHPAVVEGRTLFPSMVVKAADSPRLLVSGKNNSKIGEFVAKGPWKGMPIFTLALEERRTCPRSCALWAGCYGASSPFVRRHDALDPGFIPALKAEIETVYRAPMNANTPAPGMVVRLHVLGDFFSVEYVLAWAEMLSRFPKLHVYGYTARTSADPDPESAKIGRAVELLRDAMWSRFAVRTSTTAFGPKASVVVDADPGRADAVVCPAQTKATESCSTCALCWSAPNKAIAFLRHGMKAPPKGPRKVEIEENGGPEAEIALHGRKPEPDDVLAILTRLERGRPDPMAEARAFQQLTALGWSTASIAKRIRATQRFVQQRLKLLELAPEAQEKVSAGEVKIEAARAKTSQAGYRLDGPLSGRPALMFAHLKKIAGPDGRVVVSNGDLCLATATPKGSVVQALKNLEERGLIVCERRARPRRGGETSTWRVVAPVQIEVAPPDLKDVGPEVVAGLPKRPASTVKKPQTLGELMLSPRKPLAELPPPPPPRFEKPAPRPAEPSPVAPPRPEAVVEIVADLPPSDDPVMGLKPGRCKWPIGEPGHPKFRFCQAKCGDATYCIEHHDRAVARGQA